MVTNAGVVLLEELHLRNGRRSSMLDLAEAIVEPPEFLLTMDGACTLRLVVADQRRTLVRSPLLTERSWCDVLGVRFELVALDKSGDRVTMTYEDTVTTALRRKKSKQVIKGRSLTRGAIVAQQAKEAGVPAEIHAGSGRKVARPVERGGTVTAWDVVRDLAEERRFRCFSTGTQLVFASDEWLMSQTAAVELVEHRGAVRNIDWTLDTGRRASTARVQLDAYTGALLPGQLVTLGEECGPAAGRWLVREFRRPLTTTLADVTLTRAQHVLPEPKAAARGEHGDTGFFAGNGTDTGGKAATAARAKMVAFALAQNGKAYVYGGHGPSSWDCSGLVQGATAAAGHVLPAPSASQAAAVAAAGKSLSIDVAIKSRGALLFIQTADAHHVAISLGNGSTIEAMNPEAGVCIGRAAGRGWTSAGWWI